MPNTLTIRIAELLINRLQLTWDDVCYVTRDDTLWKRIYAEVCRLKPAVLGIIGANGKAFASGSFQLSIYNVAAPENLDRVATGRVILRRLATNTLICVIFEILSVQHDEKSWEEYERFQEERYAEQNDGPEPPWYEEDNDEKGEPETYTRVEFTEGPCGHHGYE